VSGSDPLPAKFGPSTTFPVIARDCPDCTAGLGGYLKASVDFALERDDYGPELRRWLVERLGLSAN
jgi:hypothetical protein